MMSTNDENTELKTIAARLTTIMQHLQTLNDIMREISESLKTIADKESKK